MQENILKRIRKIRKEKGVSYENLAYELNISSSAYRKIELNETKLTVERLYQIAKALNTKINILLDLQPNKIYNQQIGENALGYQDIKNLYSENKETTEKLIIQYEKRITEKDEFIFLIKNKLNAGH